MKFKNKISFLILPFLFIFLTGCAEKFAKNSGSFKHDTPLIKTDIKKLGKQEVEKSAEMGPTPAEGDVIKLKKRKQISSVKERNYLLISEDFKSLKQNVSFKFQALDFKEAMKLMSEVGQINILVGDEDRKSVV